MAIMIIQGSTYWRPAAGDGRCVGVALLEGECRIEHNRLAENLKPCHVLILPQCEVDVIGFDQARALLFTDPELPEVELARGVATVLDELCARIILEVFFDNSRPVAHQQCALEFILRQLAAGEADEPVSVTDVGRLVDRVLRYMANHLDEPLSLRSLAAEFKCSPGHLSAEFKRAGRLPPMKCLGQLRLEKAAQCLQLSDLTISQIAVSVGFADIAGFSHFFRKHMGQSPSVYRENLRWLT